MQSPASADRVHLQLSGKSSRRIEPDSNQRLSFIHQDCPTCGRLLRLQVTSLEQPIVCDHCRREFLAPASRRRTAPEDLRRRITSFLYHRCVPGADTVEIETGEGGVVVLRGNLPSRYAKRLCLRCCQRVAGVIRVVDELQVPPQKEAIEPAIGGGARPRRPR